MDLGVKASEFVHEKKKNRILSKLSSTRNDLFNNQLANINHSYFMTVIADLLRTKPGSMG